MNLRDKLEKSAFVNPFTDMGFKLIFGREESKPVLITLINELLRGEHEVEDLTFIDKEDHADNIYEKLFIYDLLCQTSTGEYIIVEMQNYRQKNFLDRALAYNCRVFANQGGRFGPKASADDEKDADRQAGSMYDRYSFQSVYGIFLMNYADPGLEKKVRTDVGLTDMETGRVINKHFRQIFIQFPYFTKKLEECVTLYDKLLYAIKNMNTLSSMPNTWKEDVFQHLKEIGLKANMTPTEKMHYDLAWVQYWGIVEAHADELREKEAKGRAEGALDNARSNARKMRQKGLDLSLISEITGLSVEEINNL